jgi:hypothetical protein
MLLGDSFELGSAMDWQHHKKTVCKNALKARYNCSQPVVGGSFAQNLMFFSPIYFILALYQSPSILQ